MAAVSPILSPGMSLGWAGEVRAVDARKSGCGAREGLLSTRWVGDVGRWVERWRFRRVQPSEWAPRAWALGERGAVIDLRAVDPGGSAPSDGRLAGREGFQMSLS
eukprot:3511778-Pyramimonas_sp.AAC.1